MRNLLSIMQEVFSQNTNHPDKVQIEKGMPIPISRMKYDVLLEYKQVLARLKPGDSFSIKKELDYPVRKLSKDHFPEYKITIRSTGTMSRVFRLA